MRKKDIGVYDKGKSDSVLETQHQLFEIDSGEVYAEIGVWSFYIAQGNLGGVEDIWQSLDSMEITILCMQHQNLRRPWALEASFFTVS